MNLAELSPEKRELLEMLLREQEAEPQVFPLSFPQARMWFLYQLDPASPAYNIPFAVRLEGPLRHAALAAAVNEIVHRHEILHTRFMAVEGQPAQEVLEIPWRIQVPLVDLTALANEARESELPRLGDAVGGWRFDLSHGPLLRLVLVRLDEGDHALLLNMHHIVSDGWSIGVFIGEMTVLYEDFLAGRPPSLPPLPLQYADYAEWQRGWLQGETLERLVAWWRQRLEGRPAALELPTDRRRGERQDPAAGRSRRFFTPEATARIQTLAESEAATPFIVLLAAFATLLGRFSRQEDVLVGTPIANRTRDELTGLIGFFVNTLVLRTDLAGDPAFRALLARVRESALGAFAHQDIPFEKLVEELHPERELAITPLFQVMLAFQNTPMPAVKPSSFSLHPAEARTGAAMFDLTLNATTTAGGSRLVLDLEYAAALFDPATADRMLASLAILLEAAVADPGLRLGELPLLSPEERGQLLLEWNDTPAPPPPGRLLHQAFEERARRDPEGIALVHGRERISAGELNRRANRLAHGLRAMGVGPERIVGVLLDRSPEMVVALLAVLKAGGAYLPLNPSYPPERRAWLLADAGASVLVTRETVDAHAAGPDHDPEPLASPENLAYLIYTSGSTGEPKGVAIRHAGAAALVDWASRFFTPEELSGVLFATSLSFDVSVFELFATLSLGGKVIVARDVLQLPELPAASEVTLVCAAPSAAAGLLRLGGLPASVRTFSFGGEPLQGSLVDRAYSAAPGLRRVLNFYGPSEDTTYSTWASVEPGTAHPLIGRSVDGKRALLLDGNLEPVPTGIPGEIWVGGVGVARGYHNRPGLTAWRFAPDPFASLWGEPGARLYRTGDLARRRPDGEIEFLGRADFQVKVRGFRIELGEVEAAVASHPGVAACAILASPDGGGGARLVAFVARDRSSVAEGLSATALRRSLRARLPEFMVPSAFVLLDGLPVTAHGKVDRQALASLEPAAAAQGAEYEPPRTPLEERLVSLAAEVLAVERVGINDNFFDLGGHSLLATQFIALLRDRWDLEVPLQSLFETATMGDLADLITERELAAADDADLAEVLAALRELEGQQG